jgi:hypothetical protein
LNKAPDSVARKAPTQEEGKPVFEKGEATRTNLKDDQSLKNESAGNGEDAGKGGNSGKNGGKSSKEDVRVSVEETMKKILNQVDQPQPAKTPGGNLNKFCFFLFLNLQSGALGA